MGTLSISANDTTTTNSIPLANIYSTPLGILSLQLLAYVTTLATPVDAQHAAPTTEVVLTMGSRSTATQPQFGAVTIEEDFERTRRATLKKSSKRKTAPTLHVIDNPADPSADSSEDAADDTPKSKDADIVKRIEQLRGEVLFRVRKQAPHALENKRLPSPGYHF